jgi:hypothetical protein
VGDPFGTAGKRVPTGYGPSTIAHVGGGTPPVAGWRSRGGHRLIGRGAAVSLGGGRAGEGGLGEWSEWLVHAAALGLLEQRSSSQRSASGQALGHQETVMRVHEGGARWPTLDAWSRGGRREAERSG